jgi:hypothetical protein
MTTCGNNYVSINGIRKCGIIDPAIVMDPYYDGEFLTYVALAGPGESIEIEFKTDGAEFFMLLAIYTGTEPPADSSRSIMPAKKGSSPPYLHPYFSDAEIEKMNF